jgi:hypothetical protein
MSPATTKPLSLGFRDLRSLMRDAKYVKMGLLVGSPPSPEHPDSGYLIPKSEWFEDVDGNVVKLDAVSLHEWDFGAPRPANTLGIIWETLAEYKRVLSMWTDHLEHKVEFLQTRGLVWHIMPFCVPLEGHDHRSMPDLANFRELPDGSRVPGIFGRIMDLEILVAETQAKLEALPPEQQRPLLGHNGPPTAETDDLQHKPRRNKRPAGAVTIGHKNAEPPIDTSPRPKMQHTWTLHRG